MTNALNRPERVAHRGASRERRENTLPAFELALERGADAIELDVHVTADGVVVVHHDPEVAGRDIASTRWRDLAGTEMAGGTRIPKLEDVLTVVGARATVYIEIKGVGSEGPTLAIAQECGSRYAVHSFDHSAVERAADIAPHVARGVLLDRGTVQAAAALTGITRRAKPRDVWPHYSLVDAEFMVAAGALGLRVIPWTVNSAPDALRFTALGVAGICTDDVRLLANL